MILLSLRPPGQSRESPSLLTVYLWKNVQLRRRRLLQTGHRPTGDDLLVWTGKITRHLFTSLYTLFLRLFACMTSRWKLTESEGNTDTSWFLGSQIVQIRGRRTGNICTFSNRQILCSSYVDPEIKTLWKIQLIVICLFTQYRLWLTWIWSWGLGQGEERGQGGERVLLCLRILVSLRSAKQL